MYPGKQPHKNLRVRPSLQRLQLNRTADLIWIRGFNAPRQPIARASAASPRRRSRAGLGSGRPSPRPCEPGHRSPRSGAPPCRQPATASGGARAGGGPARAAPSLADPPTVAHVLLRRPPTGPIRSIPRRGRRTRASPPSPSRTPTPDEVAAMLYPRANPMVSAVAPPLPLRGDRRGRGLGHDAHELGLFSLCAAAAVMRGLQVIPCLGRPSAAAAPAFSYTPLPSAAAASTPCVADDCSGQWAGDPSPSSSLLLSLSPLLLLSLLCDLFLRSVGCSSVAPTLIPALDNVYFTLVSLEAQDQIKFSSFQFCFCSCSFLFHGVFTFRLVCFPLPSSFLSSCLQMVVPSDLICLFV